MVISVWACPACLCVSVGLIRCLRPCRDTFLRSLAAAQWDKKRRSKPLSGTRASLSDDVKGPDTPPAEGGGVPPEGRAGGGGHPVISFSDVTIIRLLKGPRCFWTQMDTWTATETPVRITHNPLVTSVPGRGMKVGGDGAPPGGSQA